MKTKAVKKSKASQKAVKDTKDTQLIIGGSDSGLDESRVLNGVEAVLKLASNQGQNEEKKELFSDVDGQKVNLMVTGIKLPRSNRNHIIKVHLPNHHLSSKEVCLFVKVRKKVLFKN